MTYDITRAGVIQVWFSGARVINTQFRYALATARYPFVELQRRVDVAYVDPDSVAGTHRSVVGLERTRRDALDAARARFVANFP